MHGFKDKFGNYIKHEDEKNKLRMGGGSWTINLKEVDLSTTPKIGFVTNKGVYRISAEKAIENGFERTLGGERKLVVPIEYWDYERRL